MKTAQQLIDDNECILLDRPKWGKDYRATILIPPPFGDKVQRDTAPAQDGKEDFALYNSVLDMLEGVFAEANKRGLSSDTPIVLRAGVVVNDSILRLGNMPSVITEARTRFVVKA